jgi:DNA-binding response OmpR family regulator
MPAKTAQSNKKILIIEDEKPMAKALELKLNGCGFQAKAVFDGESAVAELTKENYDIALLDLMMPKKDGFSVLQDLKDKGIKTPVIVSSNLSQEEDVKRAKALGAVDYFVKSDTPLTEVVERIQKILG